MNSHSQAKQDLFVWSILPKREGSFLDIGSHDPIYINNTYALEKDMGWRGYLFDVDSKWIEPTRRQRTSPFIHSDLTTFDWNSFIIKENIAGKKFDYLSFDIDHASLPALRRFPFDKLSFLVATVEHDSYRFGESVANEMREIFTKNGYKILCKDVKSDGCAYEDWYIDPSILETNPSAVRFQSEGLEYSDIIKRI